ncbi:MAG TPA: DUF1116 domain-containing protein [Candidatus Bathyarchaeia archaeon]|nr:DUF1116 domain-containing protein [Candidatus Bathyarchaeia archaeon]
MPTRLRAEPTPLFSDGIRALNVGVAEFALSPRAHGATVLELDWRPPASGDRDLGLLLARLEDDPDDPLGSQVARANAQAIERILAARPMLVGMGRAADTLPGLGARHILHAGPPIAWERMCGPMQGAVIGAILYEGWAATPEAAQRFAGDGGITFAPCHHFGAVGPMAGVLSPSMPVFIVENAAGGNRAFAILNEGLGKVLRFGAYGQEVLDRLRWINETLAPALAESLRARGPVDLKNLTAQALQMGDECHNRNVAASSLFARLIAPALVRTSPPDVAAAILEFLEANNHFYLNLSMAASKATLDAAHGIEGSTVVTVMARNGVEVGVRLSGTGDAWSTAPALVPDGLYFPGYGPADANPDLGDSAITETAGLGGLAMAAAPAIVRFIGGAAEEAIATTKLMYRITLARNNDYGIPALGFAGTPTGIDARRVVDSGIAPIFNTGIAHREAGIGQVGAGIAKAPLACFAGALRELGRRLRVPV